MSSDSGNKEMSSTFYVCIDCKNFISFSRIKLIGTPLFLCALFNFLYFVLILNRKFFLAVRENFYSSITVVFR